MAIYNETMTSSTNAKTRFIKTQVSMDAWDTLEQNEMGAIVTIRTLTSGRDWDQTQVFYIYDHTNDVKQLVTVSMSGTDGFTWSHLTEKALVPVSMSATTTHIQNNLTEKVLIPVVTRGDWYGNIYNETGSPVLIRVVMAGTDTRGFSDFGNAQIVAVRTTANESQTQQDDTGATIIPVMTNGSDSAEMHEESAILRVTGVITADSWMLFNAGLTDQVLVEVVTPAGLEQTTQTETTNIQIVPVFITGLDAMDWGMPHQTRATIHVIHAYAGTAYITQ